MSDGKIAFLLSQLKTLNAAQRETAIGFLLGILAAHIPEAAWREAITESVRMVTRPPAAPTGKDASSGPDL